MLCASEGRMYICNFLLLASNVREPCKPGASIYIPGGVATAAQTPTGG